MEAIKGAVQHSLGAAFVSAAAIEKEVAMVLIQVAWLHYCGMQEFNSVEAIKGAVQHSLGAAFVSAAAIEKEVTMGLVHRLPIKDVHLSRTISLVSNRRIQPCLILPT